MRASTFVLLAAALAAFTPSCSGKKSEDSSYSTVDAFCGEIYRRVTKTSSTPAKAEWMKGCMENTRALDAKQPGLMACQAGCLKKAPVLDGVVETCFQTCEGEVPHSSP